MKKAEESEKITINLGFVDLGRIDLLVREGFYSTRSDFIRAAIRHQLAAHAEDVARSVQRTSLDVGLRDISRAELEAALAAGEMLHIRIVGLARIAADVSPDLARATIGTLTVLGALQAPPAIRSALADRIR
ncbi:CopG family transcriptional regulator [Prosthecomicrobium sp. N25]|uniref:CopG family transcriptional regulator n=1 Tax=Prosthecomicrobium sp. N25 TaxID=3129254 RepID=UPI00307885F0